MSIVGAVAFSRVERVQRQGMIGAVTPQLLGRTGSGEPSATPSGPNSANTARVCSPSPGAGDGTREGVPSNRAAGRACRTRPNRG